MKFIDMHTHGGGGHDYMDGTVEAFTGAALAHMQHLSPAISGNAFHTDDLFHQPLPSAAFLSVTETLTLPRAPTA